RCFRCHKTGHFAHQCPEAQCSRCKKWGHVSGACPEQDSSSSELSNYAVEGISATGKYGELCLVANGRVLEPWILDSGPSCHMTFSLEGMTDFKPCSRPMAGTTGEKHQIEGYGKLSLELVDESGNEAMVTLNRVAYVPALKHNLFSPMTAHKSGFSFATTPMGVSIFDGKIHLKSAGDLLMAHAALCFLVPVYTLGAVAALTPGHTPGTVIDINLFHCAFG
ncbi:unnamed protein product, partial [Discosporangium mesarthrocarpum]